MFCVVLRWRKSWGQNVSKCIKCNHWRSLWVTRQVASNKSVKKNKLCWNCLQVNRWCNQLNKGQKETVNKELKRWLLIIFNRFNNKSAEAHLHSGIFCLHKPKSFCFLLQKDVDLRHSLNFSTIWLLCPSWTTFLKEAFKCLSFVRGKQLPVYPSTSSWSLDFTVFLKISVIQRPGWNM